MSIPTIRMHRFEFIVRNSDGLICDIGSNDSSLWAYSMWYPHYPDMFVIKEIVFFDCDLWLPTWLQNPKFVRGDALNLPFKDNTFDTIVFGDILEHVSDPLKCLQDAKRVTKSKIIVTLPCESEWNVTNRIPHSDKNVVNTYCGMDDQVENQEIKSTLEHPSTMAKCTSAISEKIYKHIWHQHIFNDEKVLELLDKLNMKYNIFKLHYGIKTEELVSYGIILYQ